MLVLDESKYIKYELYIVLRFYLNHRLYENIFHILLYFI